MTIPTIGNQWIFRHQHICCWIHFRKGNFLSTKVEQMVFLMVDFSLAAPKKGFAMKICHPTWKCLPYTSPLAVASFPNDCCKKSLFLSPLQFDDSGQIRKFHQPRFPWNKGFLFLFWVFWSCEVAKIIWPNQFATLFWVGAGGSKVASYRTQLTKELQWISAFNITKSGWSTNLEE